MKSRAHGTGELARRAEWKRGGVKRSWATLRERGSIFRKRFYRQMMHRGKKRAVIAAAPALLAVVYPIILLFLRLRQRCFFRVPSFVPT
ncbi:MAG: hypothetical protein ACRD72_01780 [Candidatus Angelobacter sp.]